MKMGRKTKDICFEIREQIIKLRKDRNSLNPIAKTIGRAKSTVQTVFKKIFRVKITSKQA